MQLLSFKYLGLICFLFISNFSFAQTTQTIRGQVIDIDTRNPLFGANVLLLPDSTVASTDSSGVFRFEQVEIGRYQLMVSYVGYEPYFEPEILLESGKEIVLPISLKENPSLLTTVVVSAENPDVIQPLSVQSISVEQILRYPATFFDPARLVGTFAGVVNNNDQTNGISVRGNSPNGIAWRLEGVDIVNPNHTANAGTFSDRPTQNGGGVNILSAQLLDRSYFYKGTFSAEFGNALSGVLNMALRPGNNEKAEYTAQIGLIGIDVAAEGPISKKKGSSYLVNYRYSTIGLLSQMGLDLGDETINFQDLSFNFTFPTKKGGEFTLFGMGGLSENIFESPIDTADWEFEKDQFNIRFRSQMGAVGATYLTPVGKNGNWKTVIAASSTESTRIGEELSERRNIIGIETDTLRQTRYSIHSRFQFKLENGTNLQIGALATHQVFYNRSFAQMQDTLAFGDGEGLLLQPYMQWSAQVTPKFRLNVGVHAVYFGLNSSTSLEPRFSARYYMDNTSSFNVAYGLHSQQQPLNLYYSTFNEGQSNRSLEFTRAHHFVLGYKKNFSKALSLNVEAYYQDLFDVPITFQDNPSSFSALNILEENFDEALVNEGTGMNYGLEVSLQQQLTDDTYYLINATYYESKYKGSDGVLRDNRYNGNYIFNATVGKEYKWEKESGRVDILGLNLRVVYLGGLRETPIDEVTSAFEGKTVYFEDQAFSLQLDDYFRTDLRVYFKRNRPRFSTTLALDVQNISNQQNLSLNYFDTFQGQTLERYQLGLIPILSYRIEF